MSKRNKAGVSSTIGAKFSIRELDFYVKIEWLNGERN